MLIKQQAYWRARLFWPVCNARDLAPVLSWGSYCRPPGNKLPWGTPNSPAWPSERWVWRHMPAPHCLAHPLLYILALPHPYHHLGKRWRPFLCTMAQQKAIGMKERGLSYFWPSRAWPCCSLQPTTNMGTILRRKTTFYLFLLNISVP